MIFLSLVLLLLLPMLPLITDSSVVVTSSRSLRVSPHRHHYDDDEDEDGDDSSRGQMHTESTINIITIHRSIHLSCLMPRLEEASEWARIKMVMRRMTLISGMGNPARVVR